MIASSSTDSTVDFGSFGPVGRSAIELRLRHLATVFWLIPNAWPEPSGSFDYVVSLYGPPQSSWRSRGEPGP